MSTAELASPRELAKRTGWSVRRIRVLIAENKLRHVRVGSSVLVPFDAIDEFLELNMIVPDSGQSEEIKHG
jgi:excisionase family DNA binding protein